MYDQISNGNKTMSQTSAVSSALLRRSMRGPDMQVVMASLLSGVSDAAQIPETVVYAIASNRELQNMAVHAGIDLAKLIGKLYTLPPTALRAIQLGVAEFNTMSATEMFGPDGLPSLATLIRLGLVEPQGHAA